MQPAVHLGRARQDEPQERDRHARVAVRVLARELVLGARVDALLDRVGPDARVLIEEDVVGAEGFVDIAFGGGEVGADGVLWGRVLVKRAGG